MESTNSNASAPAGTASENVLQEADRLTSGDRNKDYGHPYDDFQRTALIWTAILGYPITAGQVALCMIGVKISRECHRPKRDNIVDLAGYARTLEMVREREDAHRHADTLAHGG